MKYVILKIDVRSTLPPTAREYPVIFPDDLTHRFVARGLIRALESEFHSEVEIVAAGFVNHHDGVAWGNSESLHLGSRPQDTDMIKRFFPGVGRTDSAIRRQVITDLRKGTPCHRTTGHGDSCTSGWECDACKVRIAAADALEAELGCIS